MKIRTVVPLLIMLLSGCATVSIDEQAQFGEKVGRVPELEKQASAPVGGVIYQQFRYISKTGYRLSDSLSTGFKLGRITASAGDFLNKATIDGKTVFCTEKMSYSELGLRPHKVVCFIDSNQDGAFEKVTAAPGAVWFENELPTKIRYSESEQLLPQSGSFKYELIYEGVTNESLHLAYREYIDDLVRPAFFQEVNYSIAKLPTTIRFRSVRIEVLSANNETMNYRILSGF